MIVVSHGLCDRCSTCIAICPADVILLEKELFVDQSLCISCGKCVRVCPAGALEMQL